MKHPLESSPAQAMQAKEQFANPDAYILDYELGKAVQEIAGGAKKAWNELFG